jgi:hypothetical protein
MKLWTARTASVFGDQFTALAIPLIAALTPLVRAEYRRAYRFPTQLNVPLMVAFTTPGGEHKNLQTYALSLNRFGLAFTCDSAIAAGTKIETKFQLTEHNVRAGGIVVRSREIQFAGKKRVENGIRFERIDPKDQDAIAKYLFWEIAPRHGRRMQLTHESQNQQPATALPEILPPDFAHAGRELITADFAMKGEPVSPIGSK